MGFSDLNGAAETIRLVEGKIACVFPGDWHVTRYDTWTFFANRFNGCCSGNKAVDFLAFSPERTLWLVELKDFRQFPRVKGISLWDDTALKARDTLAGIFAAAVDRTHPDQPFAARVLRARKLRVVLHLEQPKTHSKMFARAYNPADIQQKLKQTLKPIDAHPLVIELSNMGHVPWKAESIA